MIDSQTKTYLLSQYEIYNNAAFLPLDPISIPHQFNKKQDIEIAGFFAAILAWGNRKSILNSCNRLLALMDHDPYNFVLHHNENDLKKCQGFVHRTFNDTDLLYFIHFLQFHYQQHNTLEKAFTLGYNIHENLTAPLIALKNYFFSLDTAPQRTRKHIASPITKSTCKRINMFLRWMVRPKGPIDFGIWHTIQPHQLICPIDVHVARVARKLSLLHHPKDDWKAAVELTNNLKQIDANDPVKFDIALFSLGAEHIL
jgi:uncharacterized protein (TIGR02757 family)